MAPFYFVFLELILNGIESLQHLKQHLKHFCISLWINKVSSFSDFVQATFEPCSCSRGVPPKQVKQEKIRIISNRTREEAFEMLLNKVNTAQ